MRVNVETGVIKADGTVVCHIRLPKNYEADTFFACTELTDEIEFVNGDQDDWEIDIMNNDPYQIIKGRRKPKPASYKTKFYDQKEDKYVTYVYLDFLEIDFVTVSVEPNEEIKIIGDQTKWKRKDYNNAMIKSISFEKI